MNSLFRFLMLWTGCLSSPIVMIINMYELGKWSAFLNRNSDQNFIDIALETSEFVKNFVLRQEVIRIRQEFLSQKPFAFLMGKNRKSTLLKNAFKLKLVNQLYFYQANKKPDRQWGGSATKILSPVITFLHRSHDGICFAFHQGPIIFFQNESKTFLKWYLNIYNARTDYSFVLLF